MNWKVNKPSHLAVEFEYTPAADSTSDNPPANETINILMTSDFAKLLVESIQEQMYHFD